MCMSYRDKTFCTYYKQCKVYLDVGCDRALTEEVKKKANEWMEDPLICTFVDAPDCYEDRGY